MFYLFSIMITIIIIIGHDTLTIRILIRVTQVLSHTLVSFVPMEHAPSFSLSIIYRNCCIHDSLLAPPSPNIQLTPTIVTHYATIIQSQPIKCDFVYFCTVARFLLLLLFSFVYGPEWLRLLSLLNIYEVVVVAAAQIANVIAMRLSKFPVFRSRGSLVSCQCVCVFFASSPFPIKMQYSFTVITIQLLLVYYHIVIVYLHVL